MIASRVATRATQRWNGIKVSVLQPAIHRRILVLVEKIHNSARFAKAIIPVRYEIIQVS
jgi:hypothetical protein